MWKKFSILTSLVLVSTTGFAFPGFSSNCANCTLSNNFSSQPLGGPSVQNQAQLLNVAGLLNQRLQFPTQKEGPKASEINYTGGELPNAFHRPWEVTQMRIPLDVPYNPNFITPFYDTYNGFNWSEPSAPWNVFLPADANPYRISQPDPVHAELTFA